MEKMDKVQMNNQVVSMRKCVRQAKVHVIGKLVKTIRVLKNKKGHEKQVAKFRRKAERLAAELAIIKKIPLDDVSKHCLSENKNWREVLTQKDASLEERTIARLCEHKTVQKCVQEFYQRFPSLCSKASLLLQARESESKRVQRKININKSQNVTPEKSGFKAQVSFDRGSNISDKDNLHSELHKPSNKEESNMYDSDNRLEEKLKATACENIEEDAFVTERNTSYEALSERKSVAKHCTVSFQNVKARIEGSLEIKPFNFELNDEDSLFPSNLDKKCSEIDGTDNLSSIKKETDTIKHDSFFLGSDGQEVFDDDTKDELGNNEMSDADELDDESDGQTSKHSVSQFVGNLSAGSFSARHKADVYINSPKNKKADKYFYSEKQRKFSKNKYSATKRRVKGKRLERFPESRVLSGANKVQPRWKSSTWSSALRCENTKREKGVQGYQQSYTTKNYSHSQKQQNFQAPKGSKEALHPSWEAKRKQKKQTLLPFEGKKTKFD